MVVLTALSLFTASGVPDGPGIDWDLSATDVSSTCRSELARGRARVKAALGPSRARAMDRLIAVETAVAELDEALVAASALTTAEDRATRDAAVSCMDARRALAVELQADPAL